MRKLAIVEAAGLFAFIMAYIWKLRAGHPAVLLPAILFLPLSHLLHRESARALGFGKQSLRECAHRFAPLLALLALTMLACAMLLRTTRRMPADQAFFALAAYIPWGIFQQYLLNGFFFNRLRAGLSARAAGWTAAVLFAAAHLPNWFLMAVALMGGWCATLVYRRHRNLYFLGVAHAAIGFLLFVTVPDSVSHHLNIGPGLLHKRHTSRPIQ